jgi:hypothetical protein
VKHIKMPKELADKWLEALRSGKYKQGINTLRSRSNDKTEYRYCCLGVLQMVVGGETENSNLPTGGWLTKHNISFRDAVGDFAVAPLLESLGDTAANCNDCGIPFEEIADAIEKELDRT